VLLGDNGAGKSTVLRSIALALVGPIEAAALREDWSRWLGAKVSNGYVHVVVERHSDWDSFVGAGRTTTRYYPSVGLQIISAAHEIKSTRTRGLVREAAELHAWKPTRLNPTRHIWGSGSGWFAASYGPFRRFAGGDKELEKLYYSRPRLARHLSLFGESVSLSEAIVWLQSLQFGALEARQDGDTEGGSDGRLLRRVLEFVNQSGFLPHGASITEVTQKKVEVVDGNGCRVDIENLSDGYRSVLSMTLELVRQLVSTYGVERIFDAKDPTRIVAPGVVLIDEVDAHLHPAWQLTIGTWLTSRFPRIQFIVATHSPLVCHAAERGTIYKLPQPGSGERGRFVTGAERDRLIYGTVLDAYGTEAFGEVPVQSEAGRAKLARLAELNFHETQRKLTKVERTEQQTLRAAFPTRQHGWNDRERP